MIHISYTLTGNPVNCFYLILFALSFKEICKTSIILILQMEILRHGLNKGHNLCLSNWFIVDLRQETKFQISLFNVLPIGLMSLQQNETLSQQSEGFKLRTI